MQLFNRFVTLTLVTVVYLLLLSVEVTIGISQPLVPERVKAAAWNSDGTRLAVAGRGLWVYEDNLQTVRTTAETTQPLFTVAWSPDDSRIATGGAGLPRQVQIWDAASLELLFTFEQQGGLPQLVLWSPDSTRLVTINRAGEDIRIYNTVSGTLEHTLTGHRLEVLSLTWGPQPNHLISTGIDGTLRVWDVVTGTQLEEHFQARFIYSLTLSPDATRLAGISINPQVNPRSIDITIWNATTFEVERTIQDEELLDVALVWHPSENWLTAPVMSAKVVTWDASTGERVSAFAFPVVVWSLHYSPYGGRLAVAGVGGPTIAEGTVAAPSAYTISSIANGSAQIVVPDPSPELLQTITERCAAPSALATLQAPLAASDLEAFTDAVEALPADAIPPGCAADLEAVAAALAAASQAQETQQEIRSRPPLSVLDVQYSPDGSYLARVYAEGRLEVLDTSANRLMLEDTVDLPNPLFSAVVDWSSTGDRLAAGIGAQLYVWDAENFQLIETIEAGGEDPLVYFEDGSYIPEGFVSLQWDSTGTLLMAKSMSSRLTVWSTKQQTFIFDWVVGNNPVPVVWLADDRHITNGSSYFDIQTQEYEVRSVERIPEVTSTCGPALAMASSSDRTQIVRGTFNGCIVIQDAATGNEIAGYQIAANWASNEGGILINTTPLWGVSWSPDDSAIVAVDGGGGVQVVDIATGAVTLIAQQDGPLYAVDWANDNTAIASGGNTQAEATVFATVSVTEVAQLMASRARQAEFAITPATDG